jgi:hypothetical protein
VVAHTHTKRRATTQQKNTFEATTQKTTGGPLDMKSRPRIILIDLAGATTKSVESSLCLLSLCPQITAVPTTTSKF